jgi:hypothetical protein
VLKRRAARAWGTSGRLPVSANLVSPPALTGYEDGTAAAGGAAAITPLTRSQPARFAPSLLGGRPPARRRGEDPGIGSFSGSSLWRSCAIDHTRGQVLAPPPVRTYGLPMGAESGPALAVSVTEYENFRGRWPNPTERVVRVPVRPLSRCVRRSGVQVGRSGLHDDT